MYVRESVSMMRETVSDMRQHVSKGVSGTTEFGGVRPGARDRRPLGARLTPALDTERTDVSSRFGHLQESRVVRATLSRQRRHGRGAMFATVVAAIIAALGGIIAAIIVSNHTVDNPSPCVLPTGSGTAACIDTLRTGDEVGRSFDVTGKLANVAADYHVWVATETGNLIWPKEPEVTVGRAFDVAVVEGGNPPGGKFSVVVLLVSAKGQRTIDAWISNGNKDGFPGLRLGNYHGSMKVLAAVADLHL